MKEHYRQLGFKISGDGIGSFAPRDADIKRIDIFETNNYSASPFEGTFIGKCTQIAFSVNSVEQETNGLTSSTVYLLVKSINNPFDTIVQSNKLFSADLFKEDQPIPLRISSECLPGSLGDTECSCYIDSVHYLEEINKNESGIFVYLPQEALGRGLREKVKDHRLIYGYNEYGESTPPISQASAMNLLHPSGYDIRQYTILKKIFTELGLFDLSFMYMGENTSKLSSIIDQTGLKISSNK